MQVKTKKPVILVATKCDDANEIGIREIEKLLNRKELKQVIKIYDKSKLLLTFLNDFVHFLAKHPRNRNVRS